MTDERRRRVGYRWTRLVLVAIATFVVGCTTPDPNFVPVCGEGKTMAPDGSIHCIQGIFPPP